MPYIPKQDRLRVLAGVGSDRIPRNVGELTYLLTYNLRMYLYREATTNNFKPRFSDYAEVLGALEAAKLELYRRRIAPYEDDKMKAHGDVF